MSLTKLASLTVGTNTYKDKASGRTKCFQREIGSVMENDEGHAFILLDKYFNFGALPSSDGKSHVIININKSESSITKQTSNKASKSTSKSSKAAQKLLEPFNDELKF